MFPFEDLITDPRRVEALLDGSYICGEAGTLDYWEFRRRPLVKAFGGPGSLLDIGCANGFLLRCLVEWSAHKLEPYGIDVDENLLAQSSQLFPDLQSHFALLPMGHLEKRGKAGLPDKFDYVYWNVWDDFEFGAEAFAGWLGKARDAVKKGGRLILGFYNEDLADSKAKLKWLAQNFKEPEALIDNAPHPELFAYWTLV